MHENLVISLLHKQLTDQLESADKQLLLDWLANSSKNAEVQKDVSEIWELSKNYSPSFTPDVNKSFEKFSQRIKDTPVSTNDNPEAKIISLSPIRNWMNYAAIGVVLIGSLLVWNLTKNATAAEQMMASTINNEIKTIELDDGTIVSLNEKSSLNYPDKFNTDERVVNLEGQAFFDVSPDDKKPFIIRGGAADVIVVGTSFSFNTDNGDGIMEVEVKEGIVKLIPVGSSEELILTKNEKGSFDILNKRFSEKEVLKVSNADFFVSGKYSFKDSKYDYVFKILGSVYDVDFNFGSEEIKDCLLTSPLEFDPNDLEGTLAILTKAYNHRNLAFNKTGASSYSISAEACK